MQLHRLIASVPGASIVGNDEREITALVADSREAIPGALFVAVRGERSDGLAFAPDAVRRGAVAVVADRDVALPADVTLVRVADATIALSALAAAFYDRPADGMYVVGITGTNGKTTTSFLIQRMLEAAGLPCGRIGTLGAAFRDLELPLANTTPLAPELHRTLAQMKAGGARAVVMEVSSHALALHRVDDVRFSVGTFTNLTRDHLDFHETFEAYAAAKRRLFDLAQAAAINADDPQGREWIASLHAAGTPVVSYAIDHDADVRASALKLRADGSSFALGRVGVRVALPGRFNASNALAALATARALGMDLSGAAAALAQIDAVPGRMERIAANGITAIVDYAHTPDALANVLRAARETTSGRVTVVFGCGGDRDPGKRPQMGSVARELADRVIVTSDNPRTEDPVAIAEAIAATAGGEIELDRRRAIERALDDARHGDTVVIAGKGHETYQVIGETKTHFDDREEVRRIFGDALQR